METYEIKLNIYIAKITNLTLLIKLMEDDPDSYSELQLEEVKIKIKQVEALIVELQASIQSTSAVLITIREQVTLSEPLITKFYSKSLFQDQIFNSNFSCKFQATSTNIWC